MSAWLKLDFKKCPDYLEYRRGRHGFIVYRVNYRRDGIAIRKVIEGIDEREDTSKWVEAARIAERIVSEARFGKKEKKPDTVRCEEIIRQLIAESAGQDPATITEKKQSLIKHILPWVNEFFPFASDLTVESWPRYKAYKRSINPTMALENHVKRFRMLVNRAFELGLIPHKITIKFNVQKEDFRKKGMIISREHEELILAAALRVWRYRSIIQRDTGLRPGECRQLRKAVDQAGNPPNVVLEADRALIRIYPQDNKNNRYREIWVRSPRVLEVLRDQVARYPDSPFLFPMETDHQRPMDKHLSGWNAALRKAFDPDGKGNPIPDYTPHDWRHTYATEMFKATHDWARLCYALDMSLETANAVYLHFKAEDTLGLAQVASEASQGGGEKGDSF